MSNLLHLALLNGQTFSGLEHDQFPVVYGGTYLDSLAWNSLSVASGSWKWNSSANIVHFSW